MSNQIHKVFPYLRVRDANAAIEFYKKAFGAEEIFRLSEPSGRIGHAELRFGSFTVMLSDEYPEYGIQGPEAFGGTGSSVHLHVDDVDAMTTRAVDAGAKIIMEPQDQFYGERSSKVHDPFGHEWLLGSQIEDVSHAEMQRRFTAMFAGAA
jgi:PhnB protein